ncbi:MAG: NTP transferase domain-containing protein, partial [Gammaproteobacteria bacterium]|nr:NTP transferase domain-containing protein [Gammaproteobacteria bacterium]
MSNNPEKTMTDKRPIVEVTSIVLAAGGSRRYGRCKQLVEVNGCSLVRLGVDRLSGLFTPDRIIVVVGADSEAVAQAVSDLPVKVVLNKDWRQGLASSLKAGLNSVEPDCGAVL